MFISDSFCCYYYTPNHARKKLYTLVLSTVLVYFSHVDAKKLIYNFLFRIVVHNYQ